MPGRLDHVNVVVADMDRSVTFYRTLLGLSPIMDREISGPWFEQVTGIAGARAHCVILDAPQGGCRIELLRYMPAGEAAAESASHPASTGLRHLAVRIDDLDACLERLRQTYGQDVAATTLPREVVKSGKRMCYILDPDGAVIELCEYGAERPEFC